jgi:hypothetical protein
MWHMYLVADQYLQAFDPKPPWMLAKWLVAD